MTRKNVLVVPIMPYYRSAPKEFLGWGYIARRKVTTVATSPRLLKYRQCIASKLKGKTFDTLKAVQLEFQKIAPECAKEAEKVETKLKVRKILTL